MIRLTTEQAQQIEEALVKIADLRNLGKIQPEVIAFETLYVIRAAMAAKHQFMEGYRIGLAEMREKCAKVAERFEPDEKCSYVEYASAAIRAIKFEGDIEWKSTPLYAAPQPVQQVDLTDDEVAHAYMECAGGDIIARCHAVIAAYKEKNKC